MGIELEGEDNRINSERNRTRSLPLFNTADDLVVDDLVVYVVHSGRRSAALH